MYVYVYCITQIHRIAFEDRIISIKWKLIHTFVELYVFCVCSMVGCSHFSEITDSIWNSGRLEEVMYPGTLVELLCVTLLDAIAWWVANMFIIKFLCVPLKVQYFVLLIYRILRVILSEYWIVEGVVLYFVVKLEQTAVVDSTSFHGKEELAFFAKSATVKF